MQHSAVADSEAGCGIWRVEDGANLVHCEIPHQRLIMAFARDGVNLPRLCQCRGHMEFDISDKGFNCGESSVAGGRAVAALLLDVSEKVENQRCVDLFETDL
jgi:hypothetical protein